MAFSSAERLRVFFAYRSVFTGPQALIRKSKKIREIVEQHIYASQSFKSLFDDFGFDKVADIVKILLDQGVFESELKAKIAFPELFRASLTRDIQRNESENDAARSAAEILEELTSASEPGVLSDDHEGTDILERKLPLYKYHNHRGPKYVKAVSEPTAKTAPSLYPSYLPYNIQHLILTTAQRQLEECCFEFAAKWLPILLKEHKWDCPEAVELTKWTQTLAKRCDKLPVYAINNSSDVSLQEVFSSTHVLRNTAVYRVPTTAGEIYKMIQSASRLAQTLGDQSRAAYLENLHLNIGSRIKDMEFNKNFLENRLDQQLQAISEQRAELDRMEKEAIATMLQNDHENMLLVGSLLEDAVKTTFGRPGETGLAESVGMVNGAQESDGNDGDEHKDAVVDDLT